MPGFLRGRKLRIGDLLVNEKLITNEQLDRALEVKKESDKKLGEIIVELGFASEESVVKALSNQLGVEIVNPSQIKITDEILAMVEGQLLRKHLMIPIEMANDNTVRVAMADPMDINAIDDFTIVTNYQIEPCIATTREINIAIDKYYGNAEALTAAEQYASERKAQLAELEEDESNADIENSPIVVLVKNMIEQAARQRASDIHVEALQNKVRVRYRIDGALQEKASYDIQLLPAIIARLKVIGGMDIAEKRKPQDGRITVSYTHLTLPTKA